jgi:hypothetical protein
VTLTNFPNGVSSFGVPVIGGGSGPFEPYATYYFVDANNFTGNSSDGNTGLSPEEPFTTMGAAFNAVSSGDVITFIGNIREQLTTPTGVFGVTIIGGSTQPRNADAFTSAASGDGGRSGASWVAPASPTAATPLLKVLQQGWRFQNFLVGAGPATTPSILLYRDGGSGDDERDASHASFYGMYFSGCVYGIQTSGGLTGVTVANSIFRGCTTTAFSSITGAGIGTNQIYNIYGNRFVDNISHIVAPLNQGVIQDNIFGSFTTNGINLTGGIGNNVVTKNLLSGTYTTDTGVYIAASNDDWAGNFSADVSQSTVGDNAITTAVPTTA